jgi:cold shock CspA family protein
MTPRLSSPPAAGVAGQRHVGTVVHWRDTGFGFIREDGTGFKVFMHVTRLRDKALYTDLPPGTRLEYMRQQEEKGLAALDAVVLELGTAT